MCAPGLDYLPYRIYHMDPNTHIHMDMETKPAKKAQRLHGVRSRLVYTRTVLQHREVHMRKVRSLQLSAGCRVEAEAGRAKWAL